MPIEKSILSRAKFLSSSNVIRDGDDDAIHESRGGVVEGARTGEAGCGRRFGERLGEVGHRILLKDMGLPMS